MAAALYNPLEQLARDDSGAEEYLRTRARGIVAVYPPDLRDDEHYVGNPVYIAAASVVLQGARAMRTAMMVEPPLQFLSDVDVRRSMTQICELACSPVPPRHLRGLPCAPGGPAADLPPVGLLGQTAAVANLVKTAKTNRSVAAVLANSLEQSYRVQGVLDAAARADGNAHAADADKLILEHLNLLGGHITGDRLMYPAAKYRALPPGTVRDTLLAWSDANLPLARLVMVALGRNPADVDESTLCLLVRAGKVQIWHFDAKGHQLIILLTVGLLTRVMVSFDELGLPEDTNLRAMRDNTGEQPVVPDSTLEPAFLTRLYVAAGAALISGIACSRSVRSSHSADASGTHPEDSFRAAANDLCAGFVGLVLDPALPHHGPEGDRVQVGRDADAQQAFMCEAFKDVPELIAVIQAHPGVFLERHTLFLSEKLPVAAAFGNKSLTGQDYTTDVQFKPDVLYYDFRMRRSLMRELLELYGEGHTELAGYYRDKELSRHVDALISAQAEDRDKVAAACVAFLGGGRTRLSDAGSEYMKHFRK